MDSPVDSQFSTALEFVERVHAPDLKWIRSRQSLVRTFDEFFEEYVYVVVASGFRGRTAARFTPLLIACDGDETRMLAVFKNKRKVAAIACVFQLRHKWDEPTGFRANVARWGIDTLINLPMIGPITKFHLARNIGLSRDVAKPDLHLVRYAAEQRQSSVQSMVESIAQSHEMTVGVVDFILWVWLSHARGQTTHECCNGGARLR